MLRVLLYHVEYVNRYFLSVFRGQVEKFVAVYRPIYKIPVQNFQHPLQLFPRRRIGLAGYDVVEVWLGNFCLGIEGVLRYARTLDKPLRMV